MRALIIGSGIAGLTAAIALRKVGIEAVVYERATELREVGAGISLWSNAMKALDHLGAAGAVRERSLRLVRSQIRAKNGHRVQVEYSAPVLEQRYRLPEIVRMIHRADLVEALASQLPADSCHYGNDFVSLEDRGAEVAASFANGHADRGDLLIGADGIHSRVRAELFGTEKPRYAGYACWRGICSRPPQLEPGYVGEWWGRGRRFGLCTIPGDRLYWFATLNAHEGQHFPDEHVALRDAFHGWAEPVERAIATTAAAHLLRNDIIDRPPRRPWWKGRSVLVGDAIHPTTPNLGQGGCMAIEDSVVLARCLKRESTVQKAFAAFEEERFARTSGVTKESWRFGRIGQAEGAFSTWLRDAVFRVAYRVVGSGGLMKYPAGDVGAL